MEQNANAFQTWKEQKLEAFQLGLYGAWWTGKNVQCVPKLLREKSCGFFVGHPLLGSLR